MPSGPAVALPLTRIPQSVLALALAEGRGHVRRWQWPHPQSWREAYAVILTMLVGFLGVAYALDWLRGIL